MFGWFKKRRPLLDKAAQQVIVNAIKEAERNTSGEVRVYVESRCPHVNAADRASEIFFKLKMERTRHRNGTLVYVALIDHQLAVYGDEGIYRKVGGYDFWKEELERMRDHFKQEKIAEGIARCVSDIGLALQQYFPYEKSTDKKELPDDIVFGH